MGLLSHDHFNSTCPLITTGPQYGAEHILGPLTFHNLTTILCAAFTIITFIVSGFSMFLHATHFSNPSEQVKIFRITAIVPAFAFIYFLTGSFLSTAIYLQPWADFYESIALAGYFQLLVTFLEPIPERRDAYFDRLKHNSSGGGSLVWYHRTWLFVFQYIVFSFLVAVATDITQAAGVYCANGSGLHFAHIWLTVVVSISVSIAFLRLLVFYKRTKSELKPHNPLTKLAAIKGIVFLTFLQSIIFTILRSTGAVNPSARFSYNDINYGIPSILICGEMAVFAIFQFYAYSAKPYYANNSKLADGEKDVRYYGGPLGIRAIMAAACPGDIVQGLGQAVMYLLMVRRGIPKEEDDTAMMGLEPLSYGQVGGSESAPPPLYVPANATYMGVGAAQRETSPGSMEEGAVEGYTPKSISLRSTFKVL